MMPFTALLLFYDKKSKNCFWTWICLWETRNSYCYELVVTLHLAWLVKMLIIIKVFTWYGSIYKNFVWLFDDLKLLSLNTNRCTVILIKIESKKSFSICMLIVFHAAQYRWISLAYPRYGKFVAYFGIIVIHRTCIYWWMFNCSLWLLMRTLAQYSVFKIWSYSNRHAEKINPVYIFS